MDKIEENFKGIFISKEYSNQRFFIIRNLEERLMNFIYKISYYDNLKWMNPNEYWGISILKYNNIIRKCGAKKYDWYKKHGIFRQHDVKQNNDASKQLYFTKIEDIRKALKELEPYYIMKKLIE